VASETSVRFADERERGILLAFLLLSADDSVVDALDHGRREIRGGVWRDLHALDEQSRARTVAAWRAEAASALPDGLARLHPSWIEAALAGERSDVLTLIRAGVSGPLRALVEKLVREHPDGLRAIDADGEVPQEIGRDIARLAFGWLAPLCEGKGGPLAQKLCNLELEELLAEVTRLGARAVGRSLAGAAPALRARAMAAAGEPWAQLIGAASSAAVSPEERAAAAAFANTRIPASASTPSERLLHIGLAVLKSDLAAETDGSLYRVAGRLPAPLGRVVLGLPPHWSPGQKIGRCARPS
jgi:hypothetical protein